MASETDKIRVEPAKQSDVPALLRMARHEAEYERLTDGFAATEQRFRDSLFGPRPVAEAIIAHAGDDAIGFAVFFTAFSTFQAQTGLYLEDLFVEEPWRGRGVGGKLLGHVAAVAVQRDCPSIHWGVLKWNEPAIGFYRGIGAEQLDAWHHFQLSGSALHNLAAKSK